MRTVEWEGRKKEMGGGGGGGKKEGSPTLSSSVDPSLVPPPPPPPPPHPKRTEGGRVWVHRPNFWVMLMLQKVTAPPTKLINWTIVPPAS